MRWCSQQVSCAAAEAIGEERLSATRSSASNVAEKPASSEILLVESGTATVIMESIVNKHIIIHKIGTRMLIFRNLRTSCQQPMISSETQHSSTSRYPFPILVYVSSRTTLTAVYSCCGVIAVWCGVIHRLITTIKLMFVLKLIVFQSCDFTFIF